MNKRTLVPALSLVLLGIASAVIEGYDLKRVVKVGEESTYKFEAKFQVGGQDIKVTGKNFEKVVKVTDSSFFIEGTQKEVKVDVGGSPMDQPDGKPNGTEYGFDNLVKKIDDEESVTDTESYRMSNIQSIAAPDKAVKVGDKWTHTFAPTKVKIIGEEKTTPKATADYELLAEEVALGVPCIKVKETFKELEGENPASAEGTIWLNAKTFEQIKVDVKIKNAPIPSLPPVEVSFLLEKV